MSSYNPYVSSPPSEKQPVAMRFSPDVVSTHYDETPPSYDTPGPQGVSQQWASDGAYQCNVPRPASSISSADHSLYAPPPGPPPSFHSRAPSPSRIADYSPYPSNSSYGSPEKPNDFVSGQRFPALVTPPPPSFRRAPSRSMPYGPFEPLEVPAVGRGLEDGFVVTLPASATQPHPFGTHDVKESDWLRFLDDVRRAGAVLARDRARAAPVPQMGRSGGLLSGLLAQGIQSLQGNKAGSRNLAPVVELLQYWNQYFFNQRSIEVDLSGPVNDQDDSPPAASADSGRRGCRRERACQRRGGANKQWPEGAED